MRILITGINGFIGSHLVNHLRDQYPSIFGVSRTTQFAPEKITVVQTDLRSPENLPDRIDVIIHAAGVSPVGEVSAQMLLENNVLVTKNLREYARVARARLFINLSTVDVYGRVSVPVVDEDTFVDKQSDYGLSKYLGEMLLMGMDNPFAAVSLRMPGVVGKGCGPVWFSRVREKAQENREIAIFNPQSLFNNCIHVDDVCRAVSAILEKKITGFQAFNIASRGTMKICDIVDEICLAVNSHSIIIHDTVERTSYILSIEKIKNCFGFKPASITENLKSFLIDMG
jgi:nucleoside-diphosphate-sugar epimerase